MIIIGTHLYYQNYSLNFTIAKLLKLAMNYS